MNADPLDTRPSGADEVREAVLAAAAQLFQEGDPGSVSLRQIAARAGVNYGLLHRHFGTKADLVAAVLRRHSDRFRPSAAAEVDLQVRIAEMVSHYLGEPAVARTMSWAAVNDVAPEVLASNFADVASLLDALAAEIGDEQTTALFGVAVCLVLGVSAFDRYALTAAGAEPNEVNRSALRSAVDALISQMLASHRPLSLD